MSVIVAVKGNREEQITENDKSKFLSAGYDIIEDGKRTIAPSKTVTYAEHNKVVDENKKLKAENKKLKDTGDGKLADENAKLTSEIETLRKELEEVKAGK